jgi:hypothetical protein
MRFGSYLATAVVAAIALVGCLDDSAVEEEPTQAQTPVEPLSSSQLSVVVTGSPDCDQHLRTACPRSALACLGNADCAALFSCGRSCGAAEDDACFTECRKAHPAPWKLIDPLSACAQTEPACH